MKVSLHTAQASPTAAPGSGHAAAGCLGNTYLQLSNLLPDCHPIDGFPVPWLVERRIGSGWSRQLLFFLHDSFASVLARRDQTDVGISGALHTGVGFFGHLNAASATRPCGWGGHDRRGPDQQRFHVPRSPQDGLGPLCTPAVHHSRRTIVKSPNLTAYRFGPSLDQPRVACSW